MLSFLKGSSSMTLTSRLALIALPMALLGCTSTRDPDPQPTPASWGVPLTGGTMLVTRDGKRAVVADPDRDRILVVQLDNGTVLANTALDANDEPGRMVEDMDGRIHVALRRGGALLAIDGTTGVIQGRRAVCAEPRGVAYDQATGQVHVACATGELVSFNAAGGDAVRTLHLERDLRDIVVEGNQLIVSKFRTTELLTLNADGTIAARTTTPTVFRFGNGGPIPDGGPAGGQGSATGAPAGNVSAIPAVAWRMVKVVDPSHPTGLIVMSHQRQVQGELHTTEGGYGGGCGGSGTGHGPVEAALSTMVPGSPANSVFPIATGSLPIDIAADGRGRLAMITAGNQNITVVDTTALDQHDDNDPCGEGGGGGEHDDLGAPTSIAFTPTADAAGNPIANDWLVTYYPEVPALVVRDQLAFNASPRVIKLPGGIGYDAGRNVFHAQTTSGLACASCHPEGRDDGLVWTFAELGSRRTQSLAGGILERAPYHWTGDQATLHILMDDVFAVRMGGGKATDSQVASIGPWLDRVPAPKGLSTTTVDPGRVARGKALFESNETRCASCHNDALYTNNTVQDVGTGGAFKVPSLLGVGYRAPFMHTGCAATLAQRFDATCGGGDKHGHTSQLTAADIDDLVGYLETL